MSVGIRKQRGVVLLMMVIVLVLATITYMVSDLSFDEHQVERQIETREALNRAKQILIADAISYSDQPGAVAGRYGILPCTDNRNDAIAEGSQDGGCAAAGESSLGYLPWRNLDSGVLRDSTGACLMYAVSYRYKDTPDTMLNQDTVGMFQIVDSAGNVIDGVNPEDRAVAIIFAPNDPLPGQARNFDDASVCGLDYNNMNAYLDNDGVTNNAALDRVAVVQQVVHSDAASPTAANPLNDQFVTIKPDEIWGPIMARNDINTRLQEMTEAIAVCMRDYANGNATRRLPWPAPIDLSASGYADDNSYDDVNNGAQGYAGRVPFIVDDSNQEITGAVGANLFVEAGCNNIDLPSTAAIEAIDLTNVNDQHRMLWSNWKDHLFYALSIEYEPDNISEGICGAMFSCISMGLFFNRQAAIVFFGGVSVDGNPRTSNELGDVDERAVVANYLENNNDTDFPDLAGTNNYQSGLAGNNDTIFCITNEASGNNLNVIAC